MNEIYIEDVRENTELSESLITLLNDTVSKTLELENIDKECYVSITIVGSEASTSKRNTPS